jgi:hypothetical protein
MLTLLIIELITNWKSIFYITKKNMAHIKKYVIWLFIYFHNIEYQLITIRKLNVINKIS